MCPRVWMRQIDICRTQNGVGNISQLKHAPLHTVTRGNHFELVPGQHIICCAFIFYVSNPIYYCLRPPSISPSLVYSQLRSGATYETIGSPLLPPSHTAGGTYMPCIFIARMFQHCRRRAACVFYARRVQQLNSFPRRLASNCAHTHALTYYSKLDSSYTV